MEVVHGGLGLLPTFGGVDVTAGRVAAGTEPALNRFTDGDVFRSEHTLTIRGPGFVWCSAVPCRWPRRCQPAVCRSIIAACWSPSAFPTIDPRWSIRIARSCSWVASSPCQVDSARECGGASDARGQRPVPSIPLGISAPFGMLGSARFQASEMHVARRREPG